MLRPHRTPRPCRRGTPLSLLAALLIGTALVPPAAEAQWVWRDRNGVQASDRPPPPDVPAKDILQKPASVRRAESAASVAPAAAGASAAPAAPSDLPAAAAPAAAASNPLDAEIEARKKREEEAQRAKQKAADEANAVARAENCRRARQQMMAIDSGQRLTRTNAQGEREFLDDAQRAQEARRTRQIIDADCKPS